MASDKGISALADPNNFVLRNVATEGDIMDDPRWRALLDIGAPEGVNLPEATTAALSGDDLVRFNQLHPRTHGRFGHKFEQYLGEGEHVTRFTEAPVGEHSEKQMPMARIDTPDGPRIRIGAVDDAEQWQAGGHDHDRISEIDARVAEIEDLFDSGYDGPDADALDAERDTLEQERDRLEEPEDTVQLTPAELDRARSDVAVAVAQAQEWAQQDHLAWAGQRALDKAESAQLARIPMDQRTPEQQARLAELSDKFIFDPDGTLDVSGELTGEHGGILHWNVLGDDNGAWTLHVGVVGDEDDSGEYQDSATFGPEGAQRLLGMWSELAAAPTTAAAHLFTCANHAHVGLCTAVKDPHFEGLHPRDHGKFAKKAGGPSGLVGRLLAAVRRKKGGEDAEDELDDGPPPSEPLSPKIAKAREEFQRRAKAAATEAQALAAVPVSFDYDIKEENGKAKFRGRGRLHGTETTPERAAALEAYQSTDDVFRLGRFLRGLLPGQRKDKPGVIPDEVDGRPREEMEDLQKMADTIDGVIDESPLKDDVVVYRVVEHGAELFGRDWDIPASMEVGPKDIDKVRQLIRWKQQGWRPDMSGAEFTEHGFMSTSASDQWVKKWASRWERSGASEPVMLRMLVPKGTKGVQLSEVGEMEILLGRGHRWQIVEDHGVGADGLRHLDLMLVDE